MEQIISDLKCFTRDKRKIHLLCCCEDKIIDSISQLLFNFLDKKLEIKKSKNKIRRKLFPIRKYIRKLADKSVSFRTKRKILIDKKVRDILHPFIKNILVPNLIKTL